MSIYVTYNHTCDCCGVLIQQKSEALTADADLSIPTLSKVLNMDLCPPCHRLAAEAVEEVLRPRKLQAVCTRKFS